MNAPAQAGLPALPLKDPKLFREQCYIDGQWVSADAKKTLAVIDPASGQTLGTVPDMGAAETRRAIQAAERAWPAWRARTAKERAVILRKWFDLMMASQDDLAQLLTAEQGKPLAEALGERAGIPKGVFNVITGNSRAIGGELCANPAVRKLSFTGSTETGRTLMKQSADTIKKLSLELGGNAPFIVFDDADLDAAVEGSIASKYRNAGQTCVCANRIYVQDSVYDTFAARLAEKVKGFKVGPGTEPGVVIGPLIDQQGLEKVEKHVADALGKGARAIVGGKRHERGGLFFQPTVLANVTPAMLVSRQETFGPVAPLIRFKTEAEVIRLANDTEFGLSGYFYSRDVGRIFRVAEEMETGIVGANVGIISTEVAPFGGVKQSGLGREGSRYGLEEFLEVKYLLLGGIDK